jgi:glycolate oxidase
MTAASRTERRPTDGPATAGLAEPDGRVYDEAGFIAHVRAALGPSALLDSDYERSMYRRDAGILKSEPLGICMPANLDELRTIVAACDRFSVPFVPRGGGTGLAAGAIAGGRSGRAIVIGLNRFDRIEIDPVRRTAWAGPGVVNVDLGRAAAAHGLWFAPDPSSQIASTIGGNVATNAGGAHCLAYGVTSQHVLALDLMDGQGRVHRLGGGLPELDGFDLRGATVGSEGTFGLVTDIQVRLLPTPPVTETLLVSFPTVTSAAEAVTAILAAGCTPAALELMDKGAVELTEAYAKAGWDTSAAAVLLAEFEGLPNQVRTDVEITIESVAAFGGHRITRATNPEHRAQLWKGRKAVAGAIARVAPDYYLQDVVVPRSALATSLDRVIAAATEQRLKVVNVFHAGDGNLHPLLLIDRSEPDVEQRVLAAASAMIAIAKEVGGTLSGEHGIGLEKRDFMCDFLSEDDLDAQWRLRRAMEPTGLANPGKVLPSPHSCADMKPSLVPEGAWL